MTNIDYINEKRKSIYWNRKLSKIVRNFVNKQGSPYPIYIVSGNKHPVLLGKGWHYTNKSGDVIRYPSAYRRAWGKPIYRHSTIKIEVGIDWIMDIMELSSVVEFELGFAELFSA